MKKAVVLLSTYNGTKYLDLQIDSILKQKGVEIEILVRDDGSTDNTHAILNAYQDQGLLTWYTGDNLGPAYSFMDLIYNAPDADYYAFADQDDFWQEKKLFSAIAKLEEAGIDKPALYFSALEVVDDNLNFLFINKKKGVKFTLGETVFRNAATGCTEVFNKALKQQIAKFKPDYIMMHDHWIYLVCLALEGIVLFDPNPYIKYRQHHNNVVGTQKGMYNYLKKRIKSIKKDGGQRVGQVESLLKGYRDDITSLITREFLDDVVNYRKSFKNRLRILRNPYCRMATIEGNIAVIYAILFNKL